jgi:hypothetical protein
VTACRTLRLHLAQEVSTLSTVTFDMDTGRPGPFPLLSAALVPLALPDKVASACRPAGVLLPLLQIFWLVFGWLEGQIG